MNDSGPAEGGTIAELMLDGMTPADIASQAARIGVAGPTRFLEVLYADMIVCIRELESQAHRYHHDDEEKLTNYIAVQLRRLSYGAECEKDSRGHVDLDVTNRKCNVNWKAEAKVHKGYGTNEEGLRQLLDRYTSGRDDAAGFLLYLRVKGAMQVVANWRKRIADEGICEARRCDDDLNGRRGFVSTHYHASGIAMRVTHFPVFLHYQPTDISARKKRGARGNRTHKKGS